MEKLVKNKESLRLSMRAKRQSLSAPEKEGKDKKLQLGLMASDLWQNAQSIALYASLPEEANTWFLLAEAWRQAKTVYLPKVTPHEKGFMEFYKCASPSELRKGNFAIFEPQNEQCCEPNLKVDLMIIPGLAFDLKGDRLGYGGGYYDRYLAKNPNCAKFYLGFAYAFQILESLTVHEHDQKMSGLFTEEGFICVHS